MCSSNSNTNSNNTSTNNNSKRKLQQILPIPSKNSNININSDTNINKDSSNSLPLKTKKKYNKKRKLLSNKSNYIPSVTTKIINKNPPEFQDQPKPRHLKSCSRCRKHKTKCDYINTQPFPCSSCNKKGLTCELEIVIPIKRSNIIKNLSDNIDDLKLKVDELLSNHILLQKKCIEKGLKIDGLLDINTINYFESQNNTTNLLEFNMEEDDDDNDDDDDIDTAVPDQESERENSVAEDEEEEEQQKQSKETANDNNEIKLPTSTSMINSNTRSNSTNKLFSPVSTATSLSSDEDENEMEKLSINEEFEKDECGFIKSDYSIDEINYIKNINNNNNNNEKLNQFNLIINNSIVKSISLNNVLNYFKIFNNNYINLLLSIIKPMKDPNYYFKNFNLKFWIIILICERKFLNIELFNYIKLKLNELLLINNTNNYSNDLNNNKNSLNIELIESIITLTTYSVEFKIDDDLTYYNWLLNLKNIYSIDSNRFNSDSNSDSNSSSSPVIADYLKYINNLGIQYSLKLGLSWPDSRLIKNNNDEENDNLLENYNLNYSSKLSQEYLNCSYETNKLLANILKLDSTTSSTSANDSIIKLKQSNFIDLNYKILKLRNKIENNYFNSNSIVKNSINNYYKIILSLNLDQLDLVLNLIYLKLSLKDSIKDQFKFSNKIFKNCLIVLNKLNLLKNFNINKNNNNNNNIDFFYNLPNYIKNLFHISILLLFNLNNSIFKFKFDKKLINDFNKIFKNSYTIIFKNNFSNSNDLSTVDSNNLFNLITSLNLNFKLNKFNYFNSNLIVSCFNSSSEIDNNFKLSFNSIIKNSNNIISKLFNSNKNSELNEDKLIVELSGLLSERFNENFDNNIIKELISYDKLNDLEIFNSEIVLTNSQQKQQLEKSQQADSIETPFASATSCSSSSHRHSTQNSPISRSDSIINTNNNSSSNNTNIPIPKILDDNKFYLIDDKQLELTINNLVNDNTIDLSQRSEEENLNALNYLLKGIC